MHGVDSFRHFGLEFFSGVKIAGRFCEDFKCLMFALLQGNGWGMFWFLTLSPAVTTLSLPVALLCLAMFELLELQSLGQVATAGLAPLGTPSFAPAAAGFCGVFFLGVLLLLGPGACAGRAPEEMVVAWEQTSDMVK